MNEKQKASERQRVKFACRPMTSDNNSNNSDKINGTAVRRFRYITYLSILVYIFLDFFLFAEPCPAVEGHHIATHWFFLFSINFFFCICSVWSPNRSLVTTLLVVARFSAYFAAKFSICTNNNHRRFSAVFLILFNIFGCKKKSLRATAQKQLSTVIIIIFTFGATFPPLAVTHTHAHMLL